MRRRLRQVILMGALLALLAALPVTYAQNENGEDEIDAVAWSPSGDLIAIAGGPDSCSGNTSLFAIKLIDVTTRRVSKTLAKHICVVLSVAWSPDETKLASAGIDGYVFVWDVNTGATISQLVNSPGRKQVTWKPDGQELASTNIIDFFFDILNPFDGDVVRSYGMHEGAVQVIDWSPTGNKITGGGYTNSPEPQPVQIWDANSPDLSTPVLSLIGHQNAILTVRWSPDGAQIASGSADDTIRIWDAATGDTLKVIDTPVKVLKWHPSGMAIASGDDQAVSIWNAQTGALIQSIPSAIGKVYDLDWSPDGTQLVYVGQHTGANGEHLQIVPAPQQLLNIPIATATIAR